MFGRIPSRLLTRLHSTYKGSLRVETINPRVIRSDWKSSDTTGARYRELLAQEKSGHRFEFGKLIDCGHANLQTQGQLPITWLRQGLSLVTDIELFELENLDQIFPTDVIEKARYIVDNIPGGTGAYAHSQGIEIVRQAVAEFIERRDGVGKVNKEDLFVNNGVTSGIDRVLLTLLTGEKEGILVPYPQYRLHGANIALHRGESIPYYLELKNNQWHINLQNIKQSIFNARQQGLRSLGIFIINPGNPTGQILHYDQMAEILELCQEQNMFLVADEVLQETVLQSRPFVSFRKVAIETGSTTELFSFNSISKGFFAEAGLRASYMHLHNPCEHAKSEILKITDMIYECNTLGQVALLLACSPPKLGDPSYDTFINERKRIEENYRGNVKLMIEELNSMTNVKCNQVDGSIFVFPQVEFSPRAIAQAEAQGIKVDQMYTLKALEEIGVRLVPGSVFWDLDVSYHFRMSILPDTQKLKEALRRLKEFNEKFHQEFEKLGDVAVQALKIDQDFSQYAQPSKQNLRELVKRRNDNTSPHQSNAT